MKVKQKQKIFAKLCFVALGILILIQLIVLASAGGISGGIIKPPILSPFTKEEIGILKTYHVEGYDLKNCVMWNTCAWCDVSYGQTCTTFFGFEKCTGGIVYKQFPFACGLSGQEDLEARADVWINKQIRARYLTTKTTTAMTSKQVILK